MPPEVPGTRVTQIEPGLLRRLAQGLGNLFGISRAPAGSPQANADAQSGPIAPGDATTSQTQPLAPNPQPWMGPGQPIRPDAPARDVAGRSFDYPAGYNIGIRPRRFEGVTFEQLRSLASNYDLLRICIETVKDQMATLTGTVKPKKAPGQTVRSPADSRCSALDDFFQSPDRRHTFEGWVRQLMEELLVTDAPSIYVRRALNGEVYSLDIVDGATISPLLDSTGRMPEAPQPAYQQILKGVPAINYTSEELLYFPRNKRPGFVYGMPPVQQIIMTVSTALRREVSRLSYYTEGNVPEALVSTPAGWSPEVIERFQTIWDAMMSDQTQRRRMYFVPGDMRFQPTRGENAMMDQFDEWLARIVTYTLSLPPLAFVKQVNRDTAETSFETARAEGMQPRMKWLKAVLDHIIQRVFGYRDLEFVWEDIDDLDEAQRLGLDVQRVKMGLKSVDDVRAESGLEPIGFGPAIFGIGPYGIMFVDDLLRMHAQGALMGPAAGGAPPDATAGAPPDATAGAALGLGEPAPPGAGGAAPTGASALTALLGAHGSAAPAVAPSIGALPPALALAVGLGPRGAAGRRVDVTQQEETASDPLSNVVVHPTVLATLREAERKHGGSAGSARR